MRLIQGGKARNSREPRLAPGLPDPPEHLTEQARTEWARLGPELAAAGVLTRADRAVFAGYCQSYADWRDAREQLRKYGMIIKSPKRTVTRRKRDGSEVTETTGGYPMQSPFLAISNKAQDLMLRFMVELGLTPSSRSKVSAAPDEPPEDPARKYLG